jgi:sulfate permease, SulP family
MASLAALLLVVAWNMAEARHFARVVRTAPRSDVLVLLVCAGLTVVFDMVVAVGAGVVLAALLFMRRMAEVSGVSLAAPATPWSPGCRPTSWSTRSSGPLFFGAAHKAMGRCRGWPPGSRWCCSTSRRCRRSTPPAWSTSARRSTWLSGSNVFVVLGGVQPQPFRALVRAGWRTRRHELAIHRDFGRAVERARNAAAGRPEEEPPAV